MATRYVVLGSSFAAGRGLGASTSIGPRRVWRSTDYAHVLASRRNRDLVDVT